MKVVILAGGFRTRLGEETYLRPKPMIAIGGKPILWHIMKIYSYFGFNDFIICLGYKRYMIKEYFANYFLHNSDVTFDFSTECDFIDFITGCSMLIKKAVLSAFSGFDERFFLNYEDIDFCYQVKKMGGR